MRGYVQMLPFPRRPESMFEGVEMPVAIVLSKPGDCTLLLSRVSRIYTEERKTSYIPSNLCAKRIWKDGAQDRQVQSACGSGHLSKTHQEHKSPGQSGCPNSRFVVYYQSACWLKALTEYPFFRRNREKMLSTPWQIPLFQRPRVCLVWILLG